MKIIKSPVQMHQLSSRLKLKNKKIGFIATMGFLHKGHLSLARKSVKDCDITILSIYVNPLQFGTKEDFRSYPRDFKGDSDLAAGAGVDYIFAPEHTQMYPQKQLTTVSVEALALELCGQSRPGHFDGVTTVVTKLFNIVFCFLHVC